MGDTSLPTVLGNEIEAVAIADCGSFGATLLINCGIGVLVHDPAPDAERRLLSFLAQAGPALDSKMPGKGSLDLSLLPLGDLGEIAQAERPGAAISLRWRDPLSPSDRRRRLAIRWAFDSVESHDPFFTHPAELSLLRRQGMGA